MTNWMTKTTAMTMKKPSQKMNKVKRIPMFDDKSQDSFTYESVTFKL